MKIKKVLLVRVSSSVDKAVQHPQHGYPPLALKHIQAQFQKACPDVQVELLDLWIQLMSMEALVNYTLEQKPELVLVSSTSFDIEVANAYAAALKGKLDTIFVGTGQGYYLDVDRYTHHECDYDVILMGEPEEEFFKLFDRIRGDEPRVAWEEHYRNRLIAGERFLVHHADALPFPTYTDFEMRAYKSLYPVRINQRTVWGFLVATRGCPHKCVFCCEVVRKSSGKVQRSRSPGNVVDEMEHLARQGATIVAFEDDSFTCNREYVWALAQELVARKSKLPWIARARVDEVDRQLLQLLAQSGCVLLSYGVESGSQRIIEGVSKPRQIVPWSQLCREVFQWSHEAGIGANAFYVIGCPTETAEEIRSTIDLALQLNSDIIQVHFFTPYPGSEAYEQYKDRLHDLDPRRMFHYAKPVVSLAQVSVDELWALRAEFYRRYLMRPGFMLRHLWKYKNFYLHNLPTLWELLGIRRIL